MNSNTQRIIGFSGRLRSGKTELASVCEKYGYERLYFAKPLKLLIGSLIGGTIEEVNALKNGKIGWSKTIGDVDCIFISQQTKIPLDVVKKVVGRKEFLNTREMLQIIGTDLIREYNPDWHVSRVLEMMEDDKRYVIDDIRFTNEKKAIEDLGGDVWFVVRPNMLEVSHHISEETLRWQDFNKIIINDRSLEYLQMTWNAFMEIYDKSIKTRKEEMLKLHHNSDYLKSFLKSNEAFNSLSFLQISKDFYTYNPKYFTNSSEILKVDNNNGEIIVTLKNNQKETVNNSLEIEDLKIYA